MGAERFVVIGVGAVGGTIVTRLHSAGEDVVAVARGAHGEAIRRHGLTVHDPHGSTTVRLPCVSRPADVDWRGDEIVVLATKTQDASAVLDALAVHAPDAAVVCATNGVEAERMALRRFERTYGMAVMIVASHLEPGSVLVHHAPVSGVLDIGRCPDGIDQVSSRLVAALTSASFECVEDPAVMEIKRGKLLVNLCNALDALCGIDADTETLQQILRDEGHAVFAAAGIVHRFGDRERYRPVTQMRAAAGVPWGGGSTAQSLRRGVPTEVGYLNGEIVLLGRTYGVPVPLNALLQRLLRNAGAGREPTWLLPEEIRAMLSRTAEENP